MSPWYCADKVSKWYDCVIFTASVQEYADPVIDWLEAERKIFKARYYRQHCTVENGAYIKDLSVIERDLGKVCILDNSPISYAWHEGISQLTVLMLENAIPIEGWISDPTDNDLLHLIPFLRALRFVGDMRSLLGLRNGARKV
jgi:CTD nuclear envelope phosphatase 1